LQTATADRVVVVKAWISQKQSVDKIYVCKRRKERSVMANVSLQIGSADVNVRFNQTGTNAAG